MANGYSTSWIDTTGWSWKIVIKPAGGFVTSWNLISFHSESIKSIKYNYEYDELRAGVPDINEMTIVFDLQLIEDNALLDMLLFPTKQLTQIPYVAADFPAYNSTPFDLDGSTTTIYGGTIFEVYTDYGGSTDKKHFVGIQNIGVENGIENGELEINIQDIYKTVYQSVPIKELGWAYQKTGSIESDNFVNDLCLYNTADRFTGFVNTSFDNYFNFMTITEFLVHITDILNIHYQFFTRDETATIATPFNINWDNKYYKQSYDSTLSKGAELTGDKYIIVSKSNKEIADINDTDYEVIETIADHYSDKCESFWDLFNLLLEGENLCAFPSYESGKMYIREILYGSGGAVDLEFAQDISINFKNRQYLHNTVSNIESSGDDINSYSFSIGATNNSSELSLTNILASRVFSGTTALGNWDDRIPISSKHIFWRNKDNEHHFSTLYYKEKPSYSGNDYVGRVCFNTVHPHVNHYFGKNISGVDIYSDNYISYTSPLTQAKVQTLVDESEDFDELGSLMLQTIQTKCKSQTLADTILYVITTDYDTEINFDVDLGLLNSDRLFLPTEEKYELDLDYVPDIPATLLDKVDGKFVIISLEHTIHDENVNLINTAKVSMRNIK